MDAWWGKIQVQPGETREGQVGELTYRISRHSTSWQFAFCRARDALRPDRPRQQAPRVAAAEGEIELELRPALPDRPVVLRLETPYEVPPRRDLLFYIGVPLGMEIVATEGGHVLAAEPTVQLSNTWFGQPNQGHLAYALRLPARGRHEDVPVSATRAVLPVRLRNASEQKLVLERLCLDPGPLSLYTGVTRVWVGSLGIVYRGPDTATRLAYGTRIPVNDGPGPLLRGPRAPRPARLIARNYEATRALDVIGP